MPLNPEPRTLNPPSRGFSIRCQAGEAELVLYDVIDRWYGISAEAIHDKLKEAGNVGRIRVRINSPGGSIIEGTAIYNLLRSHPARVSVTVDGLAASMASIVAMAGDEIEIGEGAYMMIHDPTGVTWGDAEEVRAFAELLDKMKGQLVGIYARRTKQSEQDVSQWMRDETWMTAAEAVQRGFADRAAPGLKMAAVAAFDLRNSFRHVPENLSPCLLEVSDMAESQSTQNAPRPATLKELRAACPGADDTFLVAQLDGEATADQAAKAWMAEQGRRLEAANRKAADAEAKRAEAEKKAAAGAAKNGVEPLGNAAKGPKTEDAGDPIEAFEAIVAGYVAQGMRRPKAVSKAVHAHPEAHAAYIRAYNEKRGRPVPPRFE